MLIENAFADAARFFHIDALSSAMGLNLKVDFDMALLVLASGLYRLMARRMAGYDDAQARQIFRDIVDMPADTAIIEREVTVRFHRRAHLPSVLASDLIENPVNVPWWHGRSLRIIQQTLHLPGLSGLLSSVEIQARRGRRVRHRRGRGVMRR